MGRQLIPHVWSTVLALLLAIPALAFAQDTSAIAGVVRDSSGAVLPGVTVEAASPSLIEKVRTVVTDGTGQYKIVSLRPGIYTVTFSLAGFSTVMREGIELTASFTANVNADMKVGSLEETITVSSASPMVDIQNVVQAKVMTRDIIDAVPIGNKNTASIGVLIPGIVTSSQDVGGAVYGSAAIAIHGGRTGEMQGLFDGMYLNNGFGVGGSFMSIALNDQTFQEMSFETSGVGAESWMGSIRTNAIPKDGGNRFKGTFYGAYTSHGLQSDNLDAALIAKRLTATDRIFSIWDVAPAGGGPIIKDKLWFFGAYRKWQTKFTIAGQYYNASPIPYIYKADVTRPAYEGDRDENMSLRFTWQISPRNKLAIHPQHNTGYRDHFYSGGSTRLTNPDATLNYLVRPSDYDLVTWSSLVTSRLLIEAGGAYATKDFQEWPQPDIGRSPYSYTELNTNQVWGNVAVAQGNNHGYNIINKFTVSYVTGAHAAKIGYNLQHSVSESYQDATGGEITLQLLNGAASRVTVFSTPLRPREVTKYNLGIFAQDQWTVKRLTLTGGIRYDHLNSYVPAEHAGPSVWVPDRNVDFPEVDNVPDWKDWSPRFGASYDLFGNGKTAVKYAIGRYLESPNQGTYTRRANPLNAIAVSATRTWTDNGDFIPQLNELGPLGNSNFGKSVFSTLVDNSVNLNRGFNWETSASVQHELLAGTSVNVGYFRRWYGNQTYTDNTAVTAADFSPYCVTAPVDPGLPNGGGYQVCGFFDVNPTLFSQTKNVILLAPLQEEVYDGVDLNMSARLSHGIALSGGASWGRTRINTCFAYNDGSISVAPATAGATSPRTQAFCDVRPPFQPNVKVLIVYPTVWDLQASATYQGLPGQQITATRVYRGSDIALSLGRPFSGDANATVTLDVIPPGTLYTPRLNQLNLRLTRTFRFSAGRRIQGMVDLYNALNANPILLLNNAFNAQWPKPVQVLQARLLKFGVQLDF